MTGLTEHDQVTLGESYRDTISGFVGTATGRAEYLHAPPEVLIEARLGPNDDSKTRWVKEARLEPVTPRSGAGFGP